MYLRWWLFFLFYTGGKKLNQNPRKLNDVKTACLSKRDQVDTKGTSHNKNRGGDSQVKH